MSQIITFETAKLAKEVGFDSREYQFYRDNGDFVGRGGKKSGLKLPVLSGVNRQVAPYQSTLQWWLRDKHGLHCSIYPLKDGWAGDVRPIKQPNPSHISVERFPSYEELLEKLLYEGLNLIKE